MYYYKRDNCYFCYKQPCNEEGLVEITKEEFIESTSKYRH